MGSELGLCDLHLVPTDAGSRWALRKSRRWRCFFAAGKLKQGDIGAAEEAYFTQKREWNIENEVASALASSLKNSSAKRIKTSKSCTATLMR